MKIKPYLVFYIICGLIYPLIVLGALIISFRTHWALGCFTILILSYWLIYAFTTTCCRCSFYGTGRCGIPGKLVPLILKKKSIKGLALWRIKLNYYNEMFLMLYINSIYLLYPILFPLILLLSVLVFHFVYKHKRFHGLMHLWEKNEKQKNHSIHLRIKNHV